MGRDGVPTGRPRSVKSLAENLVDLLYRAYPWAKMTHL